MLRRRDGVKRRRRFALDRRPCFDYALRV